MQSVCGPDCAFELIRQNNETKKRKEQRDFNRYKKARLAELDPLTKYAKDAQDEVNRYVRLRDWDQGCISCNKPPSWDGQWHAGHMRSVGASRPTRFIVWAIRKQCSECNNKKSGNAAEMYRAMVAKFGQERMDWLYSQNTPQKRSREYLVRLKQVFKRKADRQKQRNDRR